MRGDFVVLIVLHVNGSKWRSLLAESHVLAVVDIDKRFLLKADCFHSNDMMCYV